MSEPAFRRGDIVCMRKKPPSLTPSFRQFKKDWEEWFGQIWTHYGHALAEVIIAQHALSGPYGCPEFTVRFTDGKRERLPRVWFEVVSKGGAK